MVYNNSSSSSLTTPLLGNNPTMPPGRDQTSNSLFGIFERSSKTEATPGPKKLFAIGSLEKEKTYPFVLQLLGIQKDSSAEHEILEAQIEWDSYEPRPKGRGVNWKGFQTPPNYSELKDPPLKEGVSSNFNEDIAKILSQLDPKALEGNVLDIKLLDIELEEWLRAMNRSNFTKWHDKVQNVQRDIVRFSLLLLVQEVNRLGFPFHLPIEFIDDISPDGNSEQVFLKLTELAKHMGYANSFPEFETKLRDLYLTGGLKEVVWFLTGQLRSLEIQASAIGEVLPPIDHQHLVTASIHQIYTQRKPPTPEEMETLKSIGGTPFIQTFFRNSRGDKEYLIIANITATHKTPFKKHSPAATVSNIQSIAYLRANLTDPEKRTILEEELVIWETFRRLDIPHIPQLYSRRQDGDDAELFVEGFTHRDIYGTLERLQKSPTAFGEHRAKIHEQLFFMAAEATLEFLAAIHKNGYLHLDIKPENLLHDIDEKNGIVKRIAVTDFGFVEELPENGVASSCCKGSPGYVPPEILANKVGLKASDVWSTATTLSTIKYLTMFSPTIIGTECGPTPNWRFLLYGTQEKLEKDFLEVNFDGNEARMNKYDHWILSMLKMNPEERPTAAKALEAFRKLRKEENTLL